MLRIALTGGIACGKSMAEQLFRDCGCDVLDADEVVAVLEAPPGGRPTVGAGLAVGSGGAPRECQCYALEDAAGVGVEPLREAFGDAIVDAQGGIDKRALASLVFADAEARARLEGILHPLVRAEAERWMASLDEGAIAIFSAALLFECGWGKDWEHTVCVVASPETQVRRMVAKRGMAEEDARARLAAQMPIGEKATLARWVLVNDVDEVEPLRKQVEALVAQWRSEETTESAEGTEAIERKACATRL